LRRAPTTAWNDNFIEKNYPHPAMLTALGVEAPVNFRDRYPEVMAVQYDGTVMPFDDRAFDLCWSNAVLEHVGTHANRADAQVQFLREIARVSKSAFVTTPNRWFPAEVHTRTPFLHWLPKSAFDRYLKMRGQKWAADDYMDLLSVQELRSVLKAAGITEYCIVYNRILTFTLDFVVMFGERARRQSS
jgi:ubiquinone/menaquinone biosynthesis C-methylase UbiE